MLIDRCNLVSSARPPFTGGEGCAWFTFSRRVVGGNRACKTPCGALSAVQGHPISAVMGFYR